MVWIFLIVALIWIFVREILHWNLNERYITLYKEHQRLQDRTLYEQRLLQEKLDFIAMTRQHMEKNLKDLCNDALIGSQHSFVSFLNPLLSRLSDQNKTHFESHQMLFEKMTSPLQKSLENLGQQLNQLEQSRVGGEECLKQQILQLNHAQQRLSDETNNLVTALRTPHIRGCWGEMQLRRVIELSGMVEHCDFQEQVTLYTQSNHRLRPDVIIRLSNEKTIIVDAKAPLLHYLEASSVKTTHEYDQKLKEHARILSGHIQQLADKKYWEHEKQSAEFVILFLPGEAFLSSALQAQPLLMEQAAQKQIILATPIIMIALLKTIAQGWRHQKLSDKVYQIAATGKHLYQQLEKISTRLDGMGKSIQQTNRHYQELRGFFDDEVKPLTEKLSQTLPANLSNITSESSSN